MPMVVRRTTALRQSVNEGFRKPSKRGRSGTGWAKIFLGGKFLFIYISAMSSLLPEALSVLNASAPSTVGFPEGGGGSV